MPVVPSATEQKSRKTKSLAYLATEFVRLVRVFYMKEISDVESGKRDDRCPLCSWYVGSGEATYI